MEQDVVETGRIFPLFPLSFQHSTFSFHGICGKKKGADGFHSPFTIHSQTRGEPKALAPPNKNGVFHIFPTPYYDYYNKFNR